MTTSSRYVNLNSYWLIDGMTLNFQVEMPLACFLIQKAFGRTDVAHDWMLRIFLSASLSNLYLLLSAAVVHLCKTIEHLSDPQPIVVMVSEVYHNQLRSYSTLAYREHRIWSVSPVVRAVLIRVRTVVNLVGSVILNMFGWLTMLLG